MAGTRKKSQAQRDAEQKIKALEKEIAEMKKIKKVTEKENMDRQRQDDEDKRANEDKRAAKKSKTTVYVAKIPINKDLEARVPVVAGQKGPSLWRTTKFLNGEDDLIRATAQVMRDIPDCKKYLEEPDAQMRAENIMAFKETYGQGICNAINSGRNNSQTGLKNAYIERYDSKKPLPDPLQLCDVVHRQNLTFPKEPEEPNPQDYEGDDQALKEAMTKFETKKAKYQKRYKEVKQNREWFKWYWLALLPKICGNKRWGQTIRQYGLISEHAPIENPTKKYVTSSDEALVILLYENCGQRFPYLASLPRRKYTAKELAEQAKHPKYQSAYSNSKAGSVRWGGWEAEGRSRFTELLLSIREARRREGVRALELGILKEIQKDLGLKNGKDKKRKDPPAASLTKKDEPMIPVGCESDDEFFNDTSFPTKKLTPFAGKYRVVGKQKAAAEEEKKEEEASDDSSDDTDLEEEKAKKKARKEDSEEEEDDEDGPAAGNGDNDEE